MSQRSSSPTPLTTVLLIALLCAIWGSTWVVIRGGLEDLPPFTSAAARFVLAAAAMALVTQVLRQREGGASPAAWLWLTLGALNFASSYAIVYHTETRLPSGLVALLWGIFPMLSALAGHFAIPGERLRAAHWIGFATGLLGLALLFLTDIASFGPEAIPAALFLLLSPIVSTVGNTLAKLHGKGVSSLALNRNAMAFGAVLLSALAFALEKPLEVTWTPRAAASVVYLALAGTVLTFGLYFWLMRHVAASSLSLIAYVTPVIALALGWMFGETLTLSTIGGAVLIVGSVALVVRVPKSAG
jgi:drug/metabolite transporter (DMT)-like permease